MHAFKILYFNCNYKENFFQAHTQINWGPQFSSTFLEIKVVSTNGENLEF